MEYAFSPIHGYRMYIILLIAKLVAMVLSGIIRSKRVLFLRMSKVISHIGLIVLLTDIMCKVHAEFCTLGDNIRDCKFTGIARVETLLDRMDFQGWAAYIILLVCFMVVLMFESGSCLQRRPSKRSLFLLGISVVCVILANFINSFSVYEYCGLECPGISETMVDFISMVVYGEPYYFYSNTNIASLLAIPIYISIVNYICIPRVSQDQASIKLKQLKKISNVLLVLCIIHYIRDMFLWLGSYAYAPMVVIAFAIKLQLANEIKEL